MSILANAKTKATKGSVKAAFTNEDGAIDLASIMVGIIVIGLIGGVIAATVFAVIPWAQDNAAKQQLDSVASAQNAYVGLSTDVAGGAQQSFSAGGGTRGTTGTPAVAAVAKVAPTITSPLTGGETLFDGSNAPKLAIATNDTGNAAHYSAAIKSASGKVFYITDGKTQPTNNTDNAATGLAKTSVDAVKGL
jgi:type II secretory pathway pseudopilin PulG